MCRRPLGERLRANGQPSEESARCSRRAGYPDGNGFGEQSRNQRGNDEDAHGGGEEESDAGGCEERQMAYIVGQWAAELGIVGPGGDIGGLDPKAPATRGDLRHDPQCGQQCEASGKSARPCTGEGCRSCQTAKIARAKRRL